MTELLHDLETVFSWLLETSWQASVLVALVLILQVTFRRWLNPRWHHALWMLVILRLAVPFMPESALSLFQFTPQPPPALAQSVTGPIFNSAATPAPFLSPAETSSPHYPFSLFTILALVWLGGALSFLAVTWLVNHRFAVHVKESQPIGDQRLLELAAEAQAEFHMRRSLRVIESAQVRSPAVMGLFHPTLILPEKVRSRFNDEELRFIFLHELAHLKRGDVLTQSIVALLQILHWFNPVLWLAFRRMRADREPATDALVLSRTGEAQKEPYGRVLIKLLEHYHQRHSLPTLIGILEDKNQFKRRFLLIEKFTRGAYGWSLLGVLLIGLLAVGCLTKSQAEEKKIARKASDETYLSFLIAHVKESDYQAHRREIDSAVSTGDIAGLRHLGIFNFKSSKSFRCHWGRNFIFSSGGTPGPIIEMACKPALLQGKAAVEGDLRMDWIQGATKIGPDSYRPNVMEDHAHLKRRVVSQEMTAFQPAGFVIPSLAVNPLFFNPKENYAMPTEVKDHVRYFCFVTATSNDDETREMTIPADVGSKATSPSTVPPVEETESPSNLEKLNKELLVSMEDTDARQVLVDRTKSLSDAQFLSTMAAFSRLDMTTVQAQKAIDARAAAMAKLLQSGLGERDVQVQALRAELAQQQALLKDRLAGLRQALTVDANMSRGRVALLEQEIAAAKKAGTAVQATAESAEVEAAKERIRSAREDAAARRVLLESVGHLPDDQFVSTLNAMGRSSAQTDTLNAEIAIKEADLKGLSASGFADGGPRVLALHAEIASLQENLKKDIYGMRQAMEIDLQMADSRAALLDKEEKEKSSTPSRDDFGMSAPAKKAMPGPKPRDLIEISLKVLEIPEDTYRAEKAKIDGAIEKADMGIFNNMTGVTLSSTPSVAVPAGQTGTIEAVRVFPYPTRFSTRESKPNSVSGTIDLSPTPQEFARKDLGVSAKITPTIDKGNSRDHGRIILTGKLTVTTFEGFTKSNLVGPSMPSFNTSESLFVDTLHDKELKGFWVPGEHVGEDIAAPSTPGEAKPMVKKRYLLFVSAKSVKWPPSGESHVNVSP